VTDYYADLTNLRSGLWTPEQFLHNTMSDIDQVEAIPEPWSEEDGSLATWINEIYVNSSQLYYPKGSLTGMLLDISLRDATNNARGLDDVMRALYTRFYQKGKGFTTQDLLGLLREFGTPDVDKFYQRYINGRDPLPYGDIFPKAGINVAKQVTSVPFLGLNAPISDQGKWIAQVVEPGSAAEHPDEDRRHRAEERSGLGRGVPASVPGPGRRAAHDHRTARWPADRADHESAGEERDHLPAFAQRVTHAQTGQDLAGHGDRIEWWRRLRAPFGCGCLRATPSCWGETR
jgi:hypothetical protein